MFVKARNNILEGAKISLVIKGGSELLHQCLVLYISYTNSTIHSFLSAEDGASIRA
jgi:hypothetical protein